MSEQIEQLMTDVESLKEMLIREAVDSGFAMDDQSYKRLRMRLLASASISSSLPGFLRKIRTRAEYWTYITGLYSATKDRIIYLQREFDPALTMLEEQLFTVASSSAQPTVFLPAGSDHDAFVEIRKMVKSAAAELMIVDPYVDETLWGLLANAAPTIRLRILTNRVKGDFVIEAGKFGKQHGNRVEVRLTPSYHDRFLIADAKRCWHLGSSIKDAGAKACAISEFMSPAVIAAIVSDIESVWASAKVAL
jgi:hypothetical protein